MKDKFIKTDNYEIYNYDCIEMMDLLIAEGKQVDLTVTSPPYDDLRDYEKSLVWNFDVFKKVANRLYEITKEGGVVVWVVGDMTKKGSETGTSFRQALYFKEIGFNLHDTMIWYKGPCPFPDKTRYYQSFEYMFILSKGKPSAFNPICDRKNKWSGTKVHGTRRQSDGTLKKPTGMKLGREIKEYGCRFNVWEISPERKNTTGHPAVFPEALVKDHILSWSNEGDTVFDCFMGSATTGKMALLNNRKFIGIEKVEDYFEISKQRISSNLEK